MNATRRGVLTVECPNCKMPVSNWTTTPPTEPGWYWVWSDEEDERWSGPAVIYVSMTDDNFSVWSHFIRLEAPKPPE